MLHSAVGYTDDDVGSTNRLIADLGWIKFTENCVEPFKLRTSENLRAVLVNSYESGSTTYSRLLIPNDEFVLCIDSLTEDKDGICLSASDDQVTRETLREGSLLEFTGNVRFVDCHKSIACIGWLLTSTAFEGYVNKKKFWVHLETLRIWMDDFGALDSRNYSVLDELNLGETMSTFYYDCNAAEQSGSDRISPEDNAAEDLKLSTLFFNVGLIPWICSLIVALFVLATIINFFVKVIRKKR